MPFSSLDKLDYSLSDIVTYGCGTKGKQKRSDLSKKWKIIFLFIIFYLFLNINIL
jgi:hypothetical protein